MAVFGTLGASSISFGAQLTNFICEKNHYLKIASHDFYALLIFLSFMVMFLCAVKVWVTSKFDKNMFYSQVCKIIFEKNTNFLIFIRYRHQKFAMANK
jgi:hypothetical protein